MKIHHRLAALITLFVTALITPTLAAAQAPDCSRYFVASNTTLSGELLLGDETYTELTTVGQFASIVATGMKQQAPREVYAGAPDACQSINALQAQILRLSNFSESTPRAELEGKGLVLPIYRDPNPAPQPAAASGETAVANEATEEAAEAADAVEAAEAELAEATEAAAAAASEPNDPLGRMRRESSQERVTTAAERLNELRDELAELRRTKASNTRVQNVENRVLHLEGLLDPASNSYILKNVVVDEAGNPVIRQKDLGNYYTKQELCDTFGLCQDVDLPVDGSKIAAAESSWLDWIWDNIVLVLIGVIVLVAAAFYGRTWWKNRHGRVLSS